jgi:hypothetical protein
MFFFIGLVGLLCRPIAVLDRLLGAFACAGFIAQSPYWYEYLLIMVEVSYIVR